MAVRTRWWVLLVVVAVLGVGVVGYLLGTGTSQPLSSDRTTPGNPSDPAVHGQYQIEAGSGGTTVAADGITPVGYSPSCDDAIRAATNYLVFVEEGMVTGRWTPESYAATLDELTAGLHDGSVQELRRRLGSERAELRAALDQFLVEDGAPELVGTASLALGTVHPEWGGFLVQTCAGGRAVVDVATYWKEPAGGFFGDQEGIEPGPSRRVTLSWAHDDWRLAGYDEFDHPAPVELIPRWETVLSDPPSAESRRAWMAESEMPWQEYTNANH